MANYFDNQSNWSWDVSEKNVLVTTNHGDHTHTLNVTNVPIGDMVDNTGQVMGDAHRAASHDYIGADENAGTKTEFAEAENSPDEANSNIASEASAGEDASTDNEGPDEGEDNEDGLDI